VAAWEGGKMVNNVVNNAKVAILGKMATFVFLSHVS
jgi:hypothetical protein